MHKVYKALSDPTRREILKLLRERDRTAGELAEYFSISKPSLSKHFTLLKEASLIHGTKDGTSILYSLNLSVLEEALMELMNVFKIEERRKDEDGRDS